MYGPPGKKLSFNGRRVRTWIEWNHQRSLDGNLLGYDSHRQLQEYVRDLNRLYSSEPSLH